MHANDVAHPKLIFDTPVINTILEETDLPLAEGETVEGLQSDLESIAFDHFWREAIPSNSERRSAGITFDALADASVTPSRLKKRLERIRGAAKRVFAGTAKRSLESKISELLHRLEHGPEGCPLRFTDTETAGHSGSERSAVWLCLVRAIRFLERPPKGYRSLPRVRPWASLRLDGAIQTLITFVQDPTRSREDALEAAQAIYSWTGWSINLVHGLLNTSRDRHTGDLALSMTLCNLAPIYNRTFDKNPAIHSLSIPGRGVEPNPWIRFLQAVLVQILGEVECPSIEALESRWKRLSGDAQESDLI